MATLGILERAAIRIDSATSELNGLAAGGVVISAVEFSNVVGDTQGQGAPRCEAALNLGAVSAGAFSVTAALYIWFLQQKDGVNFESPYVASGTTGTAPVGRMPDLVITGMANVNNVALTNLIGIGRMHNCPVQKALFWNQTGQALATSGNSCFIYPHTEQTY